VRVYVCMNCSYFCMYACMIVFIFLYLCMICMYVCMYDLYVRRNECISCVRVSSICRIRYVCIHGLYVCMYIYVCFYV
jgi:hypothetical protein